LGWIYAAASQAASVVFTTIGGRDFPFFSQQCHNFASGVIVPWTSSVLESDAVDGLPAAMPSLDVLAVGSQGAPSLWEGRIRDRVKLKTSDRELLEFLDGVQKQWPEGKRALYISFGS
jgi:hypothetical protein